MTDLFEQTTDLVELDPNKNYLEELVGEGKKFSTPEALAFAKAKSDAFIEQLKTEQAGLRQELNSRVKMEEFLDKLNSIPAQDKSPPSNEQDGPGAKKVDNNKPIGLTAEDALKLFDQREKAKQSAQNVESVKVKLQETLGPNYATKLEQMTNTLGLSKEFLNQVASTSPQAFLKLVGVGESKQEDIFMSPPKSQMSTPKQELMPGNRNYKYYEDLYNRDPVKYWTPAVQNQKDADVKKLGTAFYKL